jgi:LmbE family N-acetylglucosaminyl deacetylase
MALQPRLVLEESAVAFEGTFLPTSAVLDFGATAIVAPHPDDETLGCGGLIALLREHALRVGVVVMTDGGNSRPGGTSERPTLDPAQILGIAPGDVRFLGYHDGQLAVEASADFDRTVRRLRDAIATFDPQTVIMPFRGENHADHLATWHLSRYATKSLEKQPRRLEYPLLVGPTARAIFQLQNPNLWKLDISPVLGKKLRALRAGRRFAENDLRGFEGYFEFPEP